MFAVITGSVNERAAEGTTLDYLKSRCLGFPRIEVVCVGREWVALLEWASTQDKEAAKTFHLFRGAGGTLTAQEDVALCAFGVKVRQIAIGTFVD